MRFLTSAQIRSAEAKLINSLDTSLALINNAANACVRELSAFDAVCVFCGKGNNGADGYRAAKLLSEQGKAVSVCSVYEPKTPECKLLHDDCKSSGIKIVPFSDLPENINCDAVIDAIFGIGISGEVTGIGQEAIEYINRLGAYVLSVDIPSGLNSDNISTTTAVRADKTVTFTAPKMGMCFNSSVEACGEIVVRDVGIPIDPTLIPPSQPCALVPETVYPLLPRRERLSHKGTFGRLLSVTGSKGMMGAAIMSARAALCSGCGLVQTVCKKGMEDILNIAVPEALTFPTEQYSLDSLAPALDTAAALLMGCGCGNTVSARLISDILEHFSGPVVLDADALNALKGQAEILDGKNLVITPHPLEFSRLTGKSVAQIEEDRIYAARSFAAEHNITVILKGARTVIAERGGEAWVSLISTSALARGGSGDVLAGVIASLCAQGLSPFAAARLGVMLHGRSGLISSEKCGEYSVTIGDITENLKYAFMEAERYGRSRQSMG